jgi:hypothetical protein
MRPNTTPLILSLALALFAASGAIASTKSSIPDVSFRLAAKDVRGDSALVRVKAIVPKGWHIQSNAPLDEFLIPTELKTTGEGLRFGKPLFPKPMLKDFPALGGKVALFEDTVDIVVTARAAKGKMDAKALTNAVAKSSVVLRYQACNDTQCLPPRDVVARFVK